MLSAIVSLFTALTATQVVLLSILVSLLVYGYKMIRKSHDYWKEKGVKYIEPQFFVGNVDLFKRTSFPELLLEWYDSAPEERYVGAYQFLQPTLVIRDPNLVKQIGIKEFDHFTDHQTFIVPENDPMFSRNLFAACGDKWRDLRSTISPTFTSSKMKTLFVLIEECVQQFVEHFKTGNEVDGAVLELEVKDTFSCYANDVIASAAFGLKCDSMKDKNNEFFLMGKEATDFGGLIMTLKFFSFMISPFFSKLFGIKLIKTKVANYFSNVIEGTIKVRKEKNIIRPDMIHLLLEAQKERLNDETSKKLEITTIDIVANAFIFFAAGFDTTSTFLSFAFYELATHPDVQSRLRDEIKEAASDDGKVTYEGLNAMKYMDMVVCEALRLWPPGLLSDRKCTRDFTIQPERPGEKPVELKKDMVCWILTYGIHMDPQYYPEPKRFDPERFNEENRKNIDPSIYLPFGVGPRICIGSRFALMEGKLLIFHLLKEFEIVPVKKTLIPMVLQKGELTLKADGGVWLGFKRIKS